LNDAKKIISDASSIKKNDYKFKSNRNNSLNLRYQLKDEFLNTDFI
jgi:hypothetical protein